MAEKYKVVEETLGSGIKQYHIDKGQDSYVGYIWTRITKVPFEDLQIATDTARLLYDNSVTFTKDIIMYG